VRFATVVILLACTAILLGVRTRAEVVPPHKGLAGFPLRFGGWTGQVQPLGPKVLAVLGPGDFLTRVYARSATPFVSLYIAYFPSQRAGDTIHSPKNCLPGAGWAPLSSDKMTISKPDGSQAVVNRYILGNGEQRLLALYWYQAHGRFVASEYSAKFYLVADAMRMNRTDGALVRIITPIENDAEGLATAQSRAVGFADLILPMLDEYIPR
jgi:EpsI family protein